MTKMGFQFFEVLKVMDYVQSEVKNLKVNLSFLESFNFFPCLVLVWVEKICQSLMTVFVHVLKHLKDYQ